MIGYGQGGYGLGRYGGAIGGPTVSLPVVYYTNLLTSEYQQCPLFLQWLAAALQPLDDATTALISFTPAFDLSQATAGQLDILGVIVGQSRVLDFQPSGGVSPTLDDATYRLLLRARVAQNSWDGRIDSLQAIWRSLFPGGSIVIDDGQNMTATIIVVGAFDSITQDLISNGYIVPRPEGVLYNYTFSQLPIFGFSSDDGTYIAGFGAGKWS